MDETVSAQDTKKDGLRLFEEGLYEEASSKFQSAQEMFAAEGDELETAEMLNNLGVISRLQGDWDEAIAAMEEARAAFVTLGDRNREAQTLGNLGGLYASKGEREKAQECLRQAVDIFAETGDAQRQGETLLALGVQEWKTGDRGDGLDTYKAGLATLRKPSVGQKVVRGLLNFQTKLLGGGQE